MGEVVNLGLGRQKLRLADPGCVGLQRKRIKRIKINLTRKQIKF